MKNRLIALMILFSSCSFAQNRTNFNQYMVNQGVFNPGYFDNEMTLSGTMYYRKQWIGVQGAPENYAFSAAYNIGNHGIHINALSDRITVIDNTQFGLGYNYVAKLSKNQSLSFGVNASIGKFSARYNELQLQSGSDIVFQDRVNANFLNIGTGIYYEGEHLYLGFASPNIFNNQLKNSGSMLESGYNKNHFYGFLGGRFGSEQLVFTPSSMLKIVYGAPMQLDVDANFIYNDRLWFGLGGRTDKTIKTSVGILFASHFQIIYTYEAGFLAQYRNQSGSHEITLSYGNSFYKNNFSKRKYLTRKTNWRKRIKRV